ncbi:MAG: M3 family metallopeptidase, partial [Bacteroidales bacterium]|nr:M3 family metallopeptidase [Bacteroidales bacterium]
MNPLLTPSTLQFGAPAFDKIKTEHYLPAFKKAIEMARSEVDAICANSDAPSFPNTIDALARAGQVLEDVSNIFFNLNEACTSDRMQEIAEEVSPALTEYSMYVRLNRPLFGRVKAVYEAREALNLNPEQMRLLEETYKSFSRSGANLPEKDRAEYSAAQEELSLASLRFEKNALDATNAFVLEITDEKDLEGMPAFVVKAAKEEAAARGSQGWVFTLQAPSYGAFMSYSANRGQREKVWRAYNTRALGGKSDNSGNIRRIVELRERIARLLGYKSYSYYALEERMAKNPETVNAFLADLMAKTRPFALKEMSELREYAASKGFEGDIMPWDFSYWSRRLKEDRYAFTSEQLKPYFELEKVKKAVFGLATALYGLSFERENNLPVYHPDVEVYKVCDGGRFMGLLYMDFFPRESKRSGAWMTNFREQSIEGGEEKRPFVSLVTNFTKPTADTPSLLTFGEVTTLLHEFGHCLHSLLSEGTYPSLTG